MRSKQFKSHMRHTNPLMLHRREKPPKHFALKTAWEHTQRDHRTAENRKPTLKKRIHRLT